MSTTLTVDSDKFAKPDSDNCGLGVITNKLLVI